MRTLHGWRKIVVEVWIVFLVTFQLYTATFGIFEPRIQRGIHLFFILPLGFLLFPGRKNSPQDRFTYLDLFLAFLSILPPLYIILEQSNLVLRYQFVDPVSSLEIILGSLMIILLLEAIRRAVVPAMTILILVFMAYLFIAPFLHGVFYNPSPSISDIIEMEYLFANAGIFGIITGVSATFVAIFVIFGAFMEKTRTGEFFTNIACLLAGKSRGGAAKIAVISSGLFGSISGVAAANVYATGTFTIPLMKRLGFKPKFAGALEAAASTGGMLMPPVMGAGAFVMAEITNIPYIDIAIAAIIGASLYYISLIIRIHFMALKEDLHGIGSNLEISIKEVIKDTYLIIPLAVLVILLLKGYSPFMAANIAILLSFLISFVKKETMMTPSKLIDTLILSGKNMIMIALACAGAGMVVTIVSHTGLGLGLAAVITNWAGGYMLPVLVLVMITSLILGMGLPCTPAYVIAITVGAPIMTALGSDILSAHLFVFYFAILAGITPPVCIPAYCAASIAGSEPLQTGFEAFKIAIIGFLIPYIFMYNKGLLMVGGILDILSAVILVIIATCFLAGGLTKYFFRKLNYLEALICMGIAIGLTILSASPDIIKMFWVQSIIIGVGIIILLNSTKRWLFNGIKNND